jgi:hypothetical protein
LEERLPVALHTPTHHHHHNHHSRPMLCGPPLSTLVPTNPGQHQQGGVGGFGTAFLFSSVVSSPNPEALWRVWQCLLALASAVPSFLSGFLSLQCSCLSSLSLSLSLCSLCFLPLSLAGWRSGWEYEYLVSSSVSIHLSLSISLRTFVCATPGISSISHPGTLHASAASIDITPPPTSPAFLPGFNP